MGTDDNGTERRTGTDAEVAPILDAYFDGLEDGDASEIPFAPDVILEYPRTRLEGEPIRGREDVVEFIGTAAAGMPRVDVERYVIDGDSACALFEWENSGGELVPTVDYFEIEDGSIARIRIYFDRAVFLDQ